MMNLSAHCAVRRVHMRLAESTIQTAKKSYIHNRTNFSFINKVSEIQFRRENVGPVCLCVCVPVYRNAKVWCTVTMYAVHCTIYERTVCKYAITAWKSVKYHYADMLAVRYGAR